MFFIDTLVIYSSTAYIILFSGLYISKETDDFILTQNGLDTILGSWAGILACHYRTVIHI
ncbi:hypothetical protein [Peribacillus frigoritolerans]|uniref:hypothetical protein n=1 Tax=Peribacillus frigoritolerans TaxID=450367 RepID=UPI00207A5175|nr:hypothetical protein [Peribacillus frigoritolerans]USK68106.1 hypothetical protein LIT26_13915 [Peribacillus frigoritolerans]